MTAADITVRTGKPDLFNIIVFPRHPNGRLEIAAMFGALALKFSLVADQTSDTGFGLAPNNVSFPLASINSFKAGFPDSDICAFFIF